ncbi:MAG: type II secretion system protein M [Hafnia sp.]
MNKFKGRWQQISARERGLILGGSTLLILCMGYYMLWQPWIQQAQQWRNTIAREKDTVEWMLQQAPRIQAQEPAPQQGKSFSLSAVAARSALEQGLTINRLQPHGEQLTVSLAPGDFNLLMHWLTQLELQYRIRIVALDVAAQVNKPGWITINRLILERKQDG